MCNYPVKLIVGTGILAIRKSTKDTYPNDKGSPEPPRNINNTSFAKKKVTGCLCQG